jgi:hypothetical protein
MSEQTVAPVAVGSAGSGRRRVASLIAGIVVCAFAAAFLVGGGWALWKDRVDRDASGFVPIGTTTLRTETYAIVGDLHGDGPSWWWESDVLGDSRVRATSDVQQPLFIGIAPTADVFSYLRGAGYATIDSFDVTPDTTHAGGPPPGPPSRESIWATSTQGTGQQTLRWDSRPGDWSIVFMNADAGSGVAVHGDASAELPILPWLAVGLLVVGTASACIGGWLVLRGIRAPRGRASSEPQRVATSVPAAAETKEEVNA